MTTKTQWVRIVADSHRNRSILQRQAVFHVPKESQPGRTTRVLSRPVVTGENPANYVFVDLDVERQGDLLCDSRTAPVGITVLISTTKWMSSALGPLGPGFRRRFGENSVRYFRLLMAL
jgi:hypothetical protein